jgi:hypothetical protein
MVDNTGYCGHNVRELVRRDRGQIPYAESLVTYASTEAVF